MRRKTKQIAVAAFEVAVFCDVKLNDDTWPRVMD